MTDKEFELLNKLITSLGYNINEIEDIYDYEEFCEHIIQEQKELRETLKEEVIYKRTYLKSLLDCKEEYEKLKEYAQRQENQRETYYKEFLKASKALEALTEIERVCLKNQNSFYILINAVKVLRNILEIVNKTKEELQHIK